MPFSLSLIPEKCSKILTKERETRPLVVCSYFFLILGKKEIKDSAPKPQRQTHQRYIEVCCWKKNLSYSLSGGRILPESYLWELLPLREKSGIELEREREASFVKPLYHSSYTRSSSQAWRRRGPNFFSKASSPTKQIDISVLREERKTQLLFLLSCKEEKHNRLAVQGFFESMETIKKYRCFKFGAHFIIATVFVHSSLFFSFFSIFNIFAWN